MMKNIEYYLTVCNKLYSFAKFDDIFNYSNLNNIDILNNILFKMNKSGLDDLKLGLSIIKQLLNNLFDNFDKHSVKEAKSCLEELKEYFERQTTVKILMVS